MHHAHSELLAIRKSLSWRMTAPARFLLKFVLRHHSHDSIIAIDNSPTHVVYHDDSDAESERLARAQLRLFVEPARFLIVILSSQPDNGATPLTMASVTQQWYPHWTVDLDARAADPPHADWVLFVRSGDQLVPSALYHVAAALQRHPTAVVVYADEDQLLTGDKHPSSPWFKPAFDPDRMLAQSLMDGFVACRHSAIAQAGGLDPNDGSAALDGLLLRILQQLEPAAIVHIPRILYHTSESAEARAMDGVAGDQRREMLRRHLATSGLQVSVEPVSSAKGLSRISYPLKASSVKASLIIPTRDQPELLERCIESIHRYSDWPDLDILIIDNGSKEPATRRLLRTVVSTGQARVHHAPEPFNWSSLNNIGAELTQGVVLGFLNDDIEVTKPGWLEELVSQAMRPDIGVVGPKLLFPCGTIQHAGVIVVQGGAGHIHRGMPGTAGGHGQRLRVAQTVSAVTGAAMFMRRTVFDAVGRFDPMFPVNFNDVDFCIRVRQAGYRCLFTPHVELIHHESATRNLTEMVNKKARIEYDLGLFMARWGHVINEEDYHNPSLF